MKKIITTLLAVAMILSCAVIFSSCGLFAAKPELDLEEAEKNLDKADYSVTYIDDEEELLAAAMMDYMPFGLVEYLSAYDDDNSITIYVFDDAKTAKLFYKERKMWNDLDIEETKLEIKQLKHVLDQYEKDLDSDMIDELEDELKDLEKYLEEDCKEYVIGIKGKTVWCGTKDAIEDSKG